MKLSWDVLYFPEMSLPKASWFGQFILFFDRCGIIVPDENYTEECDEVTKSLLKTFVTPIAPAGHYNWGNEADKKFIQLLRGVPKADGFDEIHPGKIEFTEFFQYLLSSGLAKRGKFGPHFEVSRPHSLYVMTYLAFQLGVQPTVDMVPATGVEQAARLVANLPRPTSANKMPNDVGGIISKALVAPEGVDFRDLFEFKEKHKGLLKDFRNFIAYLSDLDRGEREKELKGLEDFSRVLKGKMQEKRWLRLIKSDFAFLGIYGAAALADSSPHSAAAVGLIPLFQRIVDELRSQQEIGQMIRDPRAYAALAHRHFSQRAEPRL